MNNDAAPMKGNLIVAIGLSVVIMLGWQFFFAPEPVPLDQQQVSDNTGSDASGITAANSATTGPAAAGNTVETAAEVAAAVPSPRITINTPRLQGSIALRGARMDDLVMLGYRETVDEDSGAVSLFRAAEKSDPYYTTFGWQNAEGSSAKTPNADSLWAASSTELAPGKPVTLTWDNGEGLVFTRVISVDENYLFTIQNGVRNTGSVSANLFPYGVLTRLGTPTTEGLYILHEGPIGVMGEELKEVDYDELVDDGSREFSSKGGWIGVTDKYWLAAFLPNQEENIRGIMRHSLNGADDRYQILYTGGAQQLAAGASITHSTNLFAGAKEVYLLDEYAEQLKLPLFDRAVDFGWFYFLTKPFFHALHWLNGLIGNFGLAILALTVLVKLVLYPLADKSYKSMAKMKLLAPEMQKLKERYGEDRQAMSQAMMKMYQEHKVNPMAGCLPILVQIPIFFSLYKILFVSLEMRHAPFYGWIDDLSAPDPSALITGFGMFPWPAPDFLMIGIWPVMMGITMWLQQKLNPAPADPMQAKMMQFLPIIFTFILAPFAAGLVIYWTWNNLLSIAQQWFITRKFRSMGKTEAEALRAVEAEEAKEAKEAKKK